MNLRSLFLVVVFLVATLTIGSGVCRSLDEEQKRDQELGTHHVDTGVGSSSRQKRAIGDFFTKIWSIGSLGKAQYDDTTSSLAKIYEILRDSFSDTYIRKPMVTVVEPVSGDSMNGESTNGTTTTTTEKYRVSRKELGRILNRNFRGLKRLAEIEKKDAYIASKYNIQEYKVQFANSIQSFVYNLPENTTAN